MKLSPSLVPAESCHVKHVGNQDILGRLLECSQLMSCSECSVYATNLCLLFQNHSLVAEIFPLFLRKECWLRPIIHKFLLEWDHSCRDICCYTLHCASRKLKILLRVSCFQPSLGVLFHRLDKDLACKFEGKHRLTNMSASSIVYC